MAANIQAILIERLDETRLEEYQFKTPALKFMTILMAEMRD